ncbi:MAG: tetratricopeptide repeat protein, partial [Planctomycetota bacterium]
KRKLGDSKWPRIEKFASASGQDSASRAAVLALMGWFRHLSCRDDEALKLFGEARAVDEDVAYGSLFEAMVAASAFLGTQKAPGLAYVGGRFQVKEPEEESEAAKEGRERFEAMLDQIAGAGVWGEASADEFRDVLTGLQGLRGGDPKASEEALTRALAMPEMVWLEADLLIARVKVRHLLEAFVRMEEDLDLLQKRFPDHVQARYFRALLSRERALAIMAKRGNSLPNYLEARAMFDRSVQENPSDETAVLGRAVLDLQIGRIHGHRGMPFREDFDNAIADFTDLLRRSPRNAQILQLRGHAFREYAVNLEIKGEDPEPWLVKAVRDLSDSLDIDRSPQTLCYRAQAYMSFAAADERRGRSPLDRYGKGRADCEEAARLSPRYITPLDLMAKMHFNEALWKVGRGQDGRADFQKTLQTWTRILTVNPKNSLALTSRGMVHAALADILMRGGHDPAAEFEAARADLEGSLKLDPRYSKSHETLGQVLIMTARHKSARGEDGGKEIRAAIKHLDEAVRLSSGYMGIRMNRVIAQLSLADILRAKKEDPKSALAAAIGGCDEIIRKAPRLGRIHGLRARAHKQYGDAERDREKAKVHYEKAAADAAVAGKRSPKDWSAHYCRGQALFALGRYGEAQKALNMARQIIGERFKPLTDLLNRVRQKLSQESEEGR